ncbi:MAG TPA: hypothetical protein VGL71_05115 [Urbifossiella sp.]|jgi:hypothetical protein
MNTHNEKLEHANIVAVFNTQDEAEDGVFGLRNAGFSDSRVGYFARNLGGLVTDFAGKGYTLVGAVLGIVVGAFLGIWAGNIAVTIEASKFAASTLPGPSGYLITAAICGAVLGGCTGAFIGWGIPRGDAVHRGMEMKEGRYVVTVNAGERTAEAWAILHRHGGHMPVASDGLRMMPIA